MSEEKRENSSGLCFRCEHRATFLEKGRGPRYECKTIEGAVCGCYMYKPVRPVVMAPNEGDNRPQIAGAMFSARSHFIGVLSGKLCAQNVPGGLVQYWIPETEESVE